MGQGKSKLLASLQFRDVHKQTFSSSLLSRAGNGINIALLLIKLDILLCILQPPVITFREIINLGSTCKHVTNNAIDVNYGAKTIAVIYSNSRIRCTLE